MEYYSAKKRKDLLFYAATWMTLTMTQKKPDTKTGTEDQLQGKGISGSRRKTGSTFGSADCLEGDEEVFRGLAVFVILICG